MGKENNQNCGIVAIVGRPNTGKSTLLNSILGEKVTIVSKIPQTTRNKIKGIFTDSRGQIVFIDTPGMHLPKHRLGSLMVRQIEDAMDGSDLVIHLVDTNDSVGEEEKLIMEKIKNVKVPVVLGLNKVDTKAAFINTYIKFWERIKGKTAAEMADDFIIMPLSGLKGINVNKLIDVIFAHLPKGPLLYPPDILSDFPQKLAIADIVREKLFELMHKEVPHSLAVYIDELFPQRKLIYIRAIIFIERESQKAIVIGKDGEILKKVGLQARKEIEAILGKKIFLETHVKVKSGWREDPRILREMGYI